RPLHREIEVRLVEHHADVDAALTHAAEPSAERQVGAFDAERIGHVLQQHDARLLLPGCGEHFPRTGAESIRQAAHRPTGPVWVAWHPDDNLLPHALELAGKKLGVVANASTAGWIFTGHEMPGHARRAASKMCSRAAR